MRNKGMRNESIKKHLNIHKKRRPLPFIPLHSPFTASDAVPAVTQ